MAKGRSQPKSHSKKSGSNKKKSNQSLLNAEEYLNLAQELINSFQLEKAIELYEKALTLEPENTNIMDGLADLYLQIGEQEKGRELLAQSTSIDPDRNPIKWLYLAQLTSGLDSLKFYQTGISLLSQTIDNLDECQKDVLKREISKAYCGIAELYLTDLCFEENAEGLCEHAANLALEYNPQGIDSLQTLANLRLSQLRASDSAKILETLSLKIFDIFEKYQSKNIKDLILDENDGINLPLVSDDIPTPETCLSIARLLIETAVEDPKLSDYATKILEYSLDLDDENPEIWFLLGINAMTKQPYCYDDALDYFEQTKELLTKSLEIEPNQDLECMMEETLEKIKEVKIKMTGEPQMGNLASIVNNAHSAPVSSENLEEWSDEEDENKMEI